jgi:hypothetical protein
MTFTPKQIRTIHAAIVSKRKAKLFRPMVFVVLLSTLGAMLVGFLDAKVFAYIAVALSVFSIMLPQLGNAPKYEDLVDILESKLADGERLEDVISDAKD